MQRYKAVRLRLARSVLERGSSMRGMVGGGWGGLVGVWGRESGKRVMIIEYHLYISIRDTHPHRRIG